MTTDEPTESDVLAMTAHHEAGHAVAAAMRGHEPYLIRIDQQGGGHTRYGARGAYDDAAFIAYAGIWAEARYIWAGRPESVTTSANDDSEFIDMVTGVTMEQGDDYSVVHDHFAMLAASLGTNVEEATYKTWDRELEDVWPYIQEQARLVMAGVWKPIRRDDVIYRDR